MTSPQFSSPDAHSPPAPGSAPPDSTGLRATVIAAGSGFALAATLPGALTSGLSLSLAPAFLAPWLMLLGLTLPRTGLSQGVLLVVAPLLVVLSLAWPGVGAPSAPAMVMVATAWLVYVALALRLLRPAPNWDVTHHPVVDTLPRERARQRVARRVYWAALALGTGLLALITPLLGSDATYREAWGEAAGAARVLVAVVGGSVSVVAVAAIVAPGLRQKTADSTLTVRRTLVRALLYVLAAAAFAGIAWAMTRTRG